MIKKVRIKFTMIAMASMTFCMILLVASINLVNYHQVDERMQNILEEIVGNKEKHNQLILPEEKQGRHAAGNQYGDRFFSVTFLNDGMSKIYIKNTAILSEEAAEKLAEKALEKEKKEGYLEEYKYLVSEINGNKNILFLDCSTEFTAMRSLLLTSILTGLLSLVIVFVFVSIMAEKAIEPLKESMEKQKRFITDAGHELKTPISVIATNMDVLSMDTGKENEWVNSTKRQVTKLRKLVEHLISLSKLEESQLELTLAPFSLTAAADECTEIYEMLAESDGKIVERHLMENIYANGDETTIRQLLTILCENAVKYAQGEISISLFKEGNKAIFETRNKWEQNVDTDELEKLFDRFYRGDESRNRDAKNSGYGLGLSIAKAIVEKNHGKIDVFEDEENRIVFRVSLLSK